MKALNVVTIAGLFSVSLLACETPPPKEKTPEHLECLERATTYLDCKEAEANGLGEMTAKPILRAVEANRRKAAISVTRCESVMSDAAADGSCAPD